jgi:DNA-binding response OmpR family regulator
LIGSEGLERHVVETKLFEILLAEDNPHDVELVRMALQECQVACTMRVISDGAQMIALLDNLDADPTTRALDLLLVDMNLPKRSGEEILKRLRSTEHYAQTPVILMSGLPSGAIEANAARHGATVYFKKPLMLDEFMELGWIARNVLERKRAAGI